MEFFERVTDAINELGLNRSNVETRLNLGNETIKRWEKSDPKLSSITKVAKFLNRSIDYFAGLTDSPNGQYSLKLSPEEFEILSVLRDPVFVQEDKENFKTIIQMLYQYRLKINTKENEV